MTIFSRGSEESQVLFSSHQPEKKKKQTLALQITHSAAIHQQTTSITQITMC